MAEEKVKVVGDRGFFFVFADLGKPSECRGCGEQIYWSTTRKGKKMPICKDDDENWVSHFSNCPEASKFRRTS